MMKRFILTVGVLFIFTTAHTQEIAVKENLEKIAGGINNALVVNIPEADRDDVSQAWRKIMKGAGAKVSGRSEIEALNVNIPLITTDTLVVFTNLAKKDGYINMVTAFRIQGVYLSSTNNPSAYREAERIIYNFAVDQAREAVQQSVDKERRKLEKLEKEFTKLDNENRDLSKDIETYTNRIQEAQKTIAKNEKQKEVTVKDIDQQKKALEAIRKKLSGIK